MKFLDPRDVSEKDCPLIMLADDRRGFLSWVIKHHSLGQYNHVCEMYKPGKIASQDFSGFRERDITPYIKPQYFLKFWKPVLTNKERKRWLDAIRADLNSPWINKKYDWLGIIGQALNIPKLQNPWLKYCSERVAARIRYVYKSTFPYQLSPSGMNDEFKKDKRFTRYCIWFND